MRPTTFDQVIGQVGPKRQLNIALLAHDQGRKFGNVLLSGPAGNGKTTLAEIVSSELACGFMRFIGPNESSVKKFQEKLSRLQNHTVIFIDEIHGLRKQSQEILYRLMEDGILEVIHGGIGGGWTQEELFEHVVVIGATTDPGMLTAPMRNRFQMQLRLEHYSEEEMFEILLIQKEFDIHDDAAEVLVDICRKTPRTLAGFIGTAENYALVDGSSIVQVKHVEQMMSDAGIDKSGMTRDDRVVIETIIKSFAGGPVGLSSIASSTGLDLKTIEHIVEPFLIEKGILVRTGRGRAIDFRRLSIMKEVG
jgi:Holliday junction DNA helicase RuvB